MSIHKRSYVISHHNPRKKVLVFLLVILAISIAALVSRVESVSRMQKNYTLTTNLKKELASATEKNQTYSEQLLQADRTIEVLKKSQEITATDNKKLQEQIYVLKKDLSLYKRVMGDNPASKAQIKVVGFDLKSLNEPGRYHYEITMVQMAQKHRWVQGSLKGVVNGVDTSGNKKQLNWQSLVDVAALPVRFRYYQELKGELTLPEGFKAESINFSLQIKGRQLAVKQHFLWPQDKETLVDVQSKRENEHA